jgi:hypothetical protein
VFDVEETIQTSFKLRRSRNTQLNEISSRSYLSFLSTSADLRFDAAYNKNKNVLGFNEFFLSFLGRVVTSVDDNNHISQYATDSRLISDLIVEIESSAASMTPGDRRCLQFMEVAKNLRTYNPSELMAYFKKGIALETNFWVTMNNEFDWTFKEISDLIDLVKANEVETSNLHQTFAKFSEDYTRSNANYDQLVAANPQHCQYYEDQRTAQNIQFGASLSQMTSSRQALVENIKTVVNLATNSTINKLLGYLNQWHLNQVQLANDSPAATTISLDILQAWFENLAKVLLQTRQQVKVVTMFENEGNSDVSLPSLYAKCCELLENLIKSSFVIEKQPPQVMKTQTRLVIMTQFRR